MDASEVDAGEMDAGDMDADEVDAGEADAGEVDVGEADADADAGKAGAGEAGADAGWADADAGEADAGEVEMRVRWIQVVGGLKSSGDGREINQGEVCRMTSSNCLDGAAPGLRREGWRALPKPNAAGRADWVATAEKAIIAARPCVSSASLYCSSLPGNKPRGSKPKSPASRSSPSIML